MSDFIEINWEKLICPISMAGEPKFCQTNQCAAWLQRQRKSGGEAKICFLISFLNAGGNALRLMGMKLNDEAWNNKDTRWRSTIKAEKKWGEDHGPEGNGI